MLRCIVQKAEELASKMFLVRGCKDACHEDDIIKQKKYLTRWGSCGSEKSLRNFPNFLLAGDSDYNHLFLIYSQENILYDKFPYKHTQNTFKNTSMSLIMESLAFIC